MRARATGGAVLAALALSGAVPAIAATPRLSNLDWAYLPNEEGTRNNLHVGVTAHPADEVRVAIIGARWDDDVLNKCLTIEEKDRTKRYKMEPTKGSGRWLYVSESAKHRRQISRATKGATHVWYEVKACDGKDCQVETFRPPC